MTRGWMPGVRTPRKGRTRRARQLGPCLALSRAGKVCTRPAVRIINGQRRCAACSR